MSPLGSAFGEPLLPRSAPPPGECSRRLRQAAILAFGALSTVQLGLGVGSLNNLCSDASSSLPWCPVLVAAFGLGGLLGSVLSARCDRLARKAVLLLSRRCGREAWWQRARQDEGGGGDGENHYHVRAISLVGDRPMSNLRLILCVLPRCPAPAGPSAGTLLQWPLCCSSWCRSLSL